MWTWLLVPPSQLPMPLAASTSVASVSGCQYLSCQCLWLPVPQLPVSQLPGTSIASSSASVAGTSASVASLGCLYLNCRCLCLGYHVCWCLGWCPGSVPWLPRISQSHVADDSCEMIVEDTHESSAQMSCRPSQFQTLITSNNNRSVICNTKNVMKI